MIRNRWKVLFCCCFLLSAWTAVLRAGEEQEMILIDGPQVDLTLSDLKKTLLSAPKEVRAQSLVRRDVILDVMKSTYLTKVAAHRARAKKLDRKPEVQARIWNRVQNILAEAELDDVVSRELKAQEADFEALAREEYLAHREEYRVPESVRVSHILLPVADDREAESVKARALELRRKILSGSLSFEDAAREFSDDKVSARNGGSLGVVVRGKMVKPFENAAFQLEPGKISEPVRTRYGYHLILVQERIPGRIKTFDEVREKLKKQVRAKAKSRIRQTYWMELESDPGLHINQKAVDSFIKNPVLVTE